MYMPKMNDEKIMNSKVEIKKVEKKP